MSGAARRTLVSASAAVIALAVTGAAPAAGSPAAGSPAAGSGSAHTRKFVPPKVQRVPVLPRQLARISQGRQTPRGPVARARLSARVAAELRTGRDRRPASTWPQANASMVTVTPAASSRTLESKFSVSVLPHHSAVAARIAGVLFTLTEPAKVTGPVKVSLSYRSFRNADGGSFGQRLRLVRLPACALSTPQVRRCEVQAPLRSVNNGRRMLISARVNPEPGPMVLAAVGGSSGSSGDYSATSLAPSGTWAEGGASGDFTWSYPIAVPPPAAGTAPAVALGYGSASVDGQTAQTDNQGSLVGEGFAIGSSYIQRIYTPCANDPEGAIASDFDDCWAGNVVTMDLNGHSTPLVLDSSTGTWHEQYDQGDRVQYLTGTDANTGNGTYDDDYWVVTTPNGTKYYFGKNRGPGWASGDAQTNSAWTVPVYGAHSGDPCYSSAGLAGSSCDQAWRWNLDFVIDPNGNTSAYYYTPETNYYGADNGTTGVEYDRDGYLNQIDYGLRDENGSIYAGSTDTNPPDEVVFGADQRCIPTSQFACGSAQFNAANAASWPDTPQDQQCLSGATCNNHAPSFWTQMRIDSITTQYYNGSGYAKVSSYAFGQSFPTAGDDELQLDTITRTGYAASGASLAVPPVELSYQLMNNRVPGYNGQPSMAAWRLTNIETETGEVISVQYSSTCTAADVPASPSSNTTLCYPVRWTPVGDPSPILDYFNKYVVDEVTVQDGNAGDPSQVTEYTYVGNPAWHYDDNQLIKAADRTWGQFRGYSTVETLTGNPQNVTNGAADRQTMTKTTYYQGMNGDTMPNGQTSTATVTDSLGETFTDANALAGLALEVQTFDGSSGAQLTDKITEQAVTAVTGSEPVPGLPAMQSAMTGVSLERDYTDLPGGGQNELKTATTDDGDGRPVLVQQSGTGIATTCTQTTYDDSTAAWIRDAAAEVIVTAQACPASAGTLTAADIVKDSRNYYDGATSLTTPPTAGNATMQSSAVTNSAGALTFQTQWTKAYDSSGRVLTSTDALGNKTTTAYTPADGGPQTKVTTTNALNQVSTKTYDPGLGATLTSTDAAGYLTSFSYDSLGRLTGVWKPGRSQAGQATPNISYAYRVSQTTPLAVTTNTLIDYGTGTGYLTSVSIYDSLGQLRQVQTAAEGGDTSVSDKFYDSHGWVWQTNNKYVVSGNPSVSLVSEAESAVNDRTITAFNGAGEAVETQDYNGGTLTESKQTVQGGDQVTTITYSPSGTVVGTPVATVTNVLGQTTEHIQYAGDPTVSPASVVSGGSPQVTAMSYTATGLQSQVTDPAGNTWSLSYDLLGRETKAVNPDSGTTVTGYDAAGNVAYVTDASGVSNNYTYDALNRKTAEYTGSTAQGSGTKVMTWVWDTLKPGLPSYQTEITSSGTYETGDLGYDAYGEPSGTWVTMPSGQPLAGTYRTQYSYSSTGLLLAETPAAAGGLPADALTFSYDKYGDPLTETGYDTYVSGAVYTPYGEVSQVDLGTGPSAAALTYSYDPQTRLITGINLSDDQPSPQVDNTAYAYNAGQQVTSITDTEGASATAPVETQCFTYDGLSRLTQAWTSAGKCASNSAASGPQPYSQSWTYDELGDILSQANGSNTMTYSYGVAGHAHAISSTTTVNSVTGAKSVTSNSYNADGGTTSLGGQSLTWNNNGELQTDGSASYIYDTNGTVLVESDSGGTTLYLPDEQLTSSNGTTTGTRYYTFNGITIGESTGSTLYWTEPNTQGTVTTAVNAFSESSPATRRTMTPFGTAVTASGDGTWPDNRTLIGDPDYAATGLVLIGAREYNPATDTFISVDPILDTGNPQAMTGYTYAADNPVDNSDPSGELIPGPGGDYCPPGQPGCEPLKDYPSGPPPQDTSAGRQAALKALLGTPVPTVISAAGLPGWLLRDLRLTENYQGSAAFTVKDMLTWLANNTDKPSSNKVWIMYCEGLSGGSISECSHNPLNGTDMYAKVPLGKMMAGIGLTALGLYGGSICEGLFGDTGAGAVACGYGAALAVNTGLTALGGKWNAQTVVLDVVTSYLGGTASFISSAATESRAIEIAVNAGTGAGNNWMNYASSTNGQPTLSGSLSSLGIGALQSYTAEGWADLFVSVADQLAVDGTNIHNGSF
ncbi:MAG TPA: RHS repeat-associated core domain-containing protein [Streptosporangiaceae bacterium]